MSILETVFVIFLASIPVVIWGYVFSYYDGMEFDLRKFFFGSIAWAVSIVPIVYADRLYEWFSVGSYLSVLSIGSSDAVHRIGAFFASFGIPVFAFLCFLFIFAYRNLLSIRITMIRILLLICWTAVLLGIGTTYMPSFGSGNLTIRENVFLTFSAILAVYVFVAVLEETMKHLSLYGSISSEFERRDIVLFATYSALGFVFLENVTYLSWIGASSGLWSSFFGTLASRSIVSLLLHVFASLILALGFVKYVQQTGIRAVRGFVFGLIGWVLVHAAFNISLTYGKTGIILLYAFFGYFFFTKAFFDERKQQGIAD